MRGSSWTRDLTNEDRETIATLQRRASSLDTMSVSRRGSTLSLGSLQSASSWAGIDDLDLTTVNPAPETEVGQSEVGQSETSEEQQNTSEEEDNPFIKTAVVWSGEHQLPVRAIIDTGSYVNIINKEVVTKLDAPVNRLTTPTSDLRTLGGNLLRTEGTVMLVLRFTDSPEYTEARFHVLSGGDSGLAFDLLLGIEWLKATRTYLDARQGGELSSRNII
jgi:hypothetical protein